MQEHREKFIKALLAKIAASFSNRNAAPWKLLKDKGECAQVRYVYVLRSCRFPKQRYIGITKSLKQRLEEHNSGCAPHTAKFAPWKVETFVGFSDEGKAVEFERYLKTGSGREFARRHF